MAQVYLAHDEVLDRDVALKILREQFAGDEQFAERFRREARSAASLSHPHIVSVYDRGEADGTAYIAMEYVPGGTLKERISREGPLELGEAVGVALQISEALGAAHRKGVIHRDIKPHNVLLTDSGVAKVTDFGIARAVSAATISQTSLVMGTASYMSPEQALGKPLDHRTDLYSLGVTLYEMLTGELPHSAESPVAVSMKHVNEMPRPPRELNPSIPEDLNAVVMKLLAKDPEDRYRSAFELARDLRRMQDGLPPLAAASPIAATRVNDRSAPAAAPAAAPRARKRRRGLRALLALALVVLAVIGVAWALSLPFQDFRLGNLLPGSTASGVEVPSVKGLAREEAQQRLEERGFEVEIQERESSAEENGTVLEQDPPAGERAPKGSTVTLTVGSGPGTVEVPEVVGLSQAEAEARLRSADLRPVLVREVPSEAYPEGVVFEQGYEPGTPVPPGTAVNIGVSTGSPPAPENDTPTRSTATATPTATPTAQPREQSPTATARPAKPKAEDRPKAEDKPEPRKGPPKVREKIIVEENRSGPGGGGRGENGGIRLPGDNSGED